MEPPNKMSGWPPYIVRMFNWLRAFVLQSRILRGPGYEVHEGPDGTVLYFSTGSGGIGGGVSSLPFQVRLMKDADGNWKRGVVFASKLFKELSEDPADGAITITGLLGSDAPTSEDPGWAATEAADKIWLEVEVDWSTGEPVVSSAVIASTSAGQTFDGGVVEHDGGAGSPAIYTQLVARLVIATIETDGSGGLKVVQLVHTHRRMGIVPADGRSAMGSDVQPVPAAYPLPL